MTDLNLSAQLKTARFHLANAVAVVTQKRNVVKSLASQLKAERVANRAARAQTRVVNAVNREAARAARISALEAKLEALRLKARSPKAQRKAAQKPSPVKLIKAA